MVQKGIQGGPILSVFRFRSSLILVDSGCPIIPWLDSGTHAGDYISPEFRMGGGVEGEDVESMGAQGLVGVGIGEEAETDRRLT